MWPRLAVMALALPGPAAVAADLAVVPVECVRLAEKVGLPPKLNAEQRRLALALIEIAMAVANDEQRKLLTRCESAIMGKAR